MAEGSTSGRSPSDEHDEVSAAEPEASGVHPQGEHALRTEQGVDVGDVLYSGRFELRAQLGRGGMGLVYEAFDRERKQLVALKTLEHVDAHAQNRLKDEFRVLADVVHPNLAELYGLFSDGDLCFFTMQLVRGVTFRQHVLGQRVGASHGATTVSGRDASSLIAASARSSAPPPSNDTTTAHVTKTHIGRLSHAAVRELFAQLAEGVHAIHEAGKLHRDLKPPNVLVRDDGRVVVLDFGLVRDLPDEKRALGAGLYAFPENPGMVWGTPEFMAPEQAAGRITTRATDWYAFGVMFYEVLTGQLPFVGDSEFVMTQKRLSEAPDPTWFAADLPQDLAQLCTRLLAMDPHARPGFTEIMRVLRPGQAVPSLAPSALVQTQTTILLGRDAELDALHAAFERARKHESSVVWIEAPSGMGKTALVHEFVTRLRLCEDAAILSGRCHEREQLPYKALDAVIDQLARYLRQLSEARLEQVTPPDVADLVRAFAALGTVFAVDEVEETLEVTRPSSEPSDARESRRRAFRALKTLVTNVSRLRPIVIVIDDLQWGDLDSARVLEELLTGPERPALLLVGAYRSQEPGSHTFLRELTEEMPQRAGVRVDRMLLQPLAPDVALQLVQALLPPAQAKARAQSIAREAAGNPFLLEALVQYQSEDAGVDSRPEVTVDALVRQRWAQLPRPAQRLLSVLAVAGQPIEQPAALEAAGLTHESHAAVSALRNGRFARTRPGIAADEIEPYHDRVRESVHAGLAPADLQDLHAHLARVLEATGRAEPELLSRHLHGAGDLRRAADFAITAAEQAAAAYAFDRAAQLCARALEYYPGERANERDLQTRVGELWSFAGRGARAAECFMAASVGLRGYEALQLQRRAAEQWLASGRIEEGLAALRAVVRAVDLSMPESPRSALLELIWLRARLRLRGTKFVPRAEREVSPSQLLQIDSCKAAAWSLGVVDQIHGALFQSKHLLLSLSCGEPVRVAVSLATQGMYLAGESEPRARAFALLAQAATVLEQHEDDYARAVMHSSRGTAHALYGEYAPARRELAIAEELLRLKCQGAMGELNTTRLFWAAALGYLGQWREQNERMSAWIADADERGDLYGSTTLRLNEASTLLWLAADDPETARRDVRDAMERWPHQGQSVQGFFSLVLPIYVELYVGDVRAAQRRVDEVTTWFKRSMLSRLAGLRAPLEMLTCLTHVGMLREGYGDANDHRHAVKRHLRYLDRSPIPYCRVFASLVRAALACCERDEKAAVAALELALQRAESAEMGMIAACVRDRLGRVMGGDAGDALRARAQHVFDAEGVRAPQSLVSLYVGACT